MRGIGPADAVVLPLDRWDVRVDWPQDPEGTDLGAYLDAHPEVTVLTNAGIFSTDLTPGGLLVADGQELRELNLADGGGNFHLKPNAVFAVHDDGTAAVVDSTVYDPTGVVHATQSGPALLLDGEVHPEFREGSENVAIRSGVGVSPDGRTVYLVATFRPVNLWDFATLFRDELGVDDALYLDGQISQLWVDGLSDDPLPYLGPYAGVITASPR
ncbi:phosphodiester glycosidase family protein [Salsipaludibacter albus]|uniref:phosphodiester glycosidase family protein n=1 Tax=Salsipaludibacter albus TaxID=2849650 RepID=UPI001EE3A4E9|nr:phosphodiester glycosidase family protein [Salsipaludibacter albus]